MVDKKLSTTEVLDLLNIQRPTLLYHMRLLRGLLKVHKNSLGRYEFTTEQVDLLKRHLRESRQIQRQSDDDSDEVVRFQDRVKQVRGIRQELTRLLRDMGPLLQGLSKTPIASLLVYTLPIPGYRLTQPVRVLLYPHRRQFRASFPEARLSAQEPTREGALLALRAALLRTYLDLPISPPTEPQAADLWRVLHELIVPTSPHDRT